MSNIIIAELKGEASNRDALSFRVGMYICSLCNAILCLCMYDDYIPSYCWPAWPYLVKNTTVCQMAARAEVALVLTAFPHAE